MWKRLGKKFYRVCSLWFHGEENQKLTKFSFTRSFFFSSFFFWLMRLRNARVKFRVSKVQTDRIHGRLCLCCGQAMPFTFLTFHRMSGSQRLPVDIIGMSNSASFFCWDSPFFFCWWPQNVWKERPIDIFMAFNFIFMAWLLPYLCMLGITPGSDRE